MTNPKTRRVRIAVAISPTDWNCGGWGLPDENADDLVAESIALEGMEPIDQTVIYFIEADVPVPDPNADRVTIEGRVTK